MEYVEKLIGNISLVYASEKVKLVKGDNDGNVIEIIDMSVNRFRDDFKMVVLSYFNEILDSEDVSPKRIRKLIDNIDEVVDILLAKAAINLAYNTSLLKESELDDDLRAKRIGRALFRTDLNIPSSREIVDKMILIKNIEDSYSKGKMTFNFYQESLLRCNSEIELMYCARGEADFQFDDDLIVRISQDIMDDCESYKCFMRGVSNKKRKIFKSKKLGFFGKKMLR